MKQIGYQDAAQVRGWEIQVPGAIYDPGRYTELFTHDLDEKRENVNADVWTHVGWILPADATAQGGGVIYETKLHAGTSCVPAYVKAVKPAEPSITDRLTALETKLNNHEQRSSHNEMWKREVEKRLNSHNAVIDSVRGHREPGRHSERLDDLDRAVAALARERVNVAELARMPPADSTTFWDHAFIHAAVNHPEWFEAELSERAIEQARHAADYLTNARRSVQTTDLPADRA